MFRRAAIAAVLLAGLAATAQADTPAPVPAPAAMSLASVKLSSCSRTDHTASFSARMRRTAQGQRLKLRFKLLERGADGSFRPVDAPALARWRSSRPGVRAFAYKQNVKGLSPDSAYRARVDFRWYAADGTLARKLRRHSGTCSQSGPLPNLRARTVGSQATPTSGVRRYTVRLANTGEAAADGAKVRFAVEGASSEDKAVGRLAAGDFALVSFLAPDCTTAVTATADPAGELAESVETDNSQRLACADVP